MPQHIRGSSHLGRNSQLRGRVVGIPKSRLRRGKIFRGNPFSMDFNGRLKKHRQNHIDAGNPMDMIEKHMKVMRVNMSQGLSFSDSHIVAQKEYPMK